MLGDDGGSLRRREVREIKGELACQQLKQDDPEGVNVGVNAHSIAPDLFRSSIGGCHQP